MSVISIPNTNTVVLNDASPTASSHSAPPTPTTPNHPPSNQSSPSTTTPNKQAKNTKARQSNNRTDMFDVLEDISRQRESWELIAYKKSNDQLYSILSRCLDIYQQMKGRTLAELNQRKKLNDALTALNISFTDATSLPTKIVRFVFRTDRKRSHTYSRVITFAHEHGIDAMTLPRWISEQGGVEEVRRKSTNALTPSQLNVQYKEAAEKFLAKSNELIAAFKTVKGLEISTEGNLRYTVGIMRDNGDGTTSVVYGIKNEAVVKAALHHAGKAITESGQLANQNTKRRQVKSQRSSILSKAS